MAADSPNGHSSQRILGTTVIFRACMLCLKHPSGNRNEILLVVGGSDRVVLLMEVDFLFAPVDKL